MKKVQVQVQGHGICFLWDVKSLIMGNWVSNGVTLNQHYYMKVLKTFGNVSEKKKHNCGNCFLLMGSGQHTALSVIGPETHHGIWPPTSFTWSSSGQLFQFFIIQFRNSG